MGKMQNGESVKPVDVYETNGKKYIIDGHHRTEAAKRVGVDISIKEVPLESTDFSSAGDVQQAGSEASSQRTKLNNKLTNQAASGQN